ncbi:hypothetical protein ACFSJW_24800 [Flavobacterium artemisiae]|uniref:Uncharacterized protein n=1 Tax=Flavobacterium artemisiae TaxID=2126556 RepID=A0ABW4HFW2_9FLAO
MLILFVVFWVVVILFVFFTVKFTIAALEDGHEENKKGKIEKARFENLPILKAIVLDTDSIKTPFSKKNVNVCLMNSGVMSSYKVGRMKSSKARRYSSSYSIFSTIYQRPYINLQIDGKKYILNSNEIVLTNNFSNNMVEGNKSGLWGAEFTTDRDLDELLFLNNYDFYKQYTKSTLKQEKEYLEKVKIFCSFRNTYEHINCYYLDKFVKKDIPDNCNNFYAYRYHLREFTFSTGDTISFKGKIVNNKIVPLH